MLGGDEVIVQGQLRSGRWFGRPDILRRVDKETNFGDWGYEVHDTKLATETRGGTILQLSVFSDLVGEAQGATPEYFHVVTPEAPVQKYRVDDFAAYLRFVREGDVWRPAAGTFPGWPTAAKGLTVLDPCMGSGHFLAFALPMLVALRQVF